MSQATRTLAVDTKVIRESLHDMAKCAKAVDLVYVSDDMPGLRRKRVGQRFSSKKLVLEWLMITSEI